LKDPCESSWRSHSGSSFISLSCECLGNDSNIDGWNKDLRSILVRSEVGVWKRAVLVNCWSSISLKNVLLQAVSLEIGLLKFSLLLVLSVVFTNFFFVISTDDLRDVESFLAILFLLFDRGLLRCLCTFELFSFNFTGTKVSDEIVFIWPTKSFACWYCCWRNCSLSAR